MIDSIVATTVALLHNETSNLVVGAAGTTRHKAACQKPSRATITQSVGSEKPTLI